LLVIADSFDAQQINCLLESSGVRIPEMLTVVEAELSDLTAGKTKPDPALGLAQALAYANKGYPTIVVARQQYREISEWAKLNSMNNVFICSALSHENLARAIKTLS